MNNEVTALLVSGGTVYVGGSFQNVVTPPRYRSLVALSTTTGQLTGSEMNTNSSVYALAISNGALFVGGDFDSCPVKFRYGIGAIDLKTKQVLDWYPNPSIVARGVCGPVEAARRRRAQHGRLPLAGCGTQRHRHVLPARGCS